MNDLTPIKKTERKHSLFEAEISEETENSRTQKQ